VQYLKSHDTRKLNLGSGENVLEGWLNTDLLPLDTRVTFLDATHKFPFDDNTFDYIFSEHMIEHVSYDECSFILQECYRVLKPGGVIRIATPNIRFLVDLFKEKKSDTQERYIQWAVNTYFPKSDIYSETIVVNNFFYNWGHQFIYDIYMLKKVLKDAKFGNIIESIPRESGYDALKGLEHHGAIIPYEFSCLETMVIEGEKINK
jgi:predicted SAM-dependent methyltransferase